MLGERLYGRFGFNPIPCLLLAEADRAALSVAQLAIHSAKRGSYAAEATRLPLSNRMQLSAFHTTRSISPRLGG